MGGDLPRLTYTAPPADPGNPRPARVSPPKESREISFFPLGWWLGGLGRCGPWWVPPAEFSAPPRDTALRHSGSFRVRENSNCPLFSQTGSVKKVDSREIPTVHFFLKRVASKKWTVLRISKMRSRRIGGGCAKRHSVKKVDSREIRPPPFQRPLSERLETSAPTRAPPPTRTGRTRRSKKVDTF